MLTGARFVAYVFRAYAGFAATPIQGRDHSEGSRLAKSIP